MNKIMIMVLTVLTLMSCSKNGDDRIAEQEGIRSREQVEAQNNNQREWSEKMEKRISQLENKNTAMSRTITKQRDRITELEKYIEQLESEIQIYNKKKRE